MTRIAIYTGYSKSGDIVEVQTPCTTEPVRTIKQHGVRLELRAIVEPEHTDVRTNIARSVRA